MLLPISSGLNYGSVLKILSGGAQVIKDVVKGGFKYLTGLVSVSNKAGITLLKPDNTQPTGNRLATNFSGMSDVAQTEKSLASTNRAESNSMPSAGICTPPALPPAAQPKIEQQTGLASVASDVKDVDPLKESQGLVRAAFYDLLMAKRPAVFKGIPLDVRTAIADLDENRQDPNAMSGVTNWVEKLRSSTNPEIAEKAGTAFESLDRYKDFSGNFQQESKTLSIQLKELAHLSTIPNIYR